MKGGGMWIWHLCPAHHKHISDTQPTCDIDICDSVKSSTTLWGDLQVWPGEARTPCTSLPLTNTGAVSLSISFEYSNFNVVYWYCHTIFVTRKRIGQETRKEKLLNKEVRWWSIRNPIFCQRWPIRAQYSRWGASTRLRRTRARTSVTASWSSWQSSGCLGPSTSSSSSLSRRILWWSNHNHQTTTMSFHLFNKIFHCFKLYL